MINLVKPIFCRPFIGALSLQLGENLKICIEFWIRVCEKFALEFELCHCVLTHGKFVPASPTFLGGDVV